MEGYIKLHRGLIDSEIFASQKGLKIWIWLLLKASHKKRFIPLQIGKGETSISINRGQLIFGRFKAEEELGIDGSTIYKWVKKMELLDMINLKSSNQYTIITINKYNTFNPIEDNKSNNRVTTDEQQMSSRVTTDEQQSNTYKKDKKVKESKEEEIKDDFDLICEKWFEYKKQRKESYKSDLSKKSLKTRLIKLSNSNIEIAKEIIEQSISNNWAGIFEIKENKNQQTNFQEPIRNNKL